MNAVRPGEGNELRVVLKFVLPPLACVLALMLGLFIASYGNPFTTTTLLVASAMCPVAIVNPKAGLYLLILSTGYLDLIKRLGILTNSLSETDIVVTLAVAPALSASVCAGAAIHHICGGGKLKGWQWVLLWTVLGLVVAIFLQSFLHAAGTLSALQEFANSGSYLPLIFVAGLILPGPDDLRRFLKFCLWVYVPVALYGIWQQFFGLTDFELDYLKSGFTTDIRLLDDVRMRPFSTLNSPHALSVCMAICSGLAAFVPLKGLKRAGWQILLALLFAAGCLATFVRSGWVLLVLAWIVWVCCRQRVSTLLMYGAAAAGLVMLMCNADTLLKSLDQFENYLPSDGDLEDQAFRLGTFSDRLFSFRNVLTNPAFHTWFGYSDSKIADMVEGSHEDIAHEQLGQILIKYGFVGLGLFATVLLLGLWYAHRAIFRQRNSVYRESMLGCLSLLIATLFSGMLFGSHLGVFPVGVFFALIAGCFCALAMCQGEELKQPSKTESKALLST
jgi:hypothetical protein